MVYWYYHIFSNTLGFVLLNDSTFNVHCLEFAGVYIIGNE